MPLESKEVICLDDDDDKENPNAPETTSMEDPNQTQELPDPEPAAEPETADNNLPSTQPDKITPPISATPEFLSIHVRTPRARFAWQELAGTPNTPRMKETLGISPNAKLSWGSEGDGLGLDPGRKRKTTGERGSGGPQERGGGSGSGGDGDGDGGGGGGGDVGSRSHEQQLSEEDDNGDASKRMKKRKHRHSLSPPSSPSSSKSRKVALNIQRFKEALQTALANPPPPPPHGVRSRLARYHTALGTGGSGAGSSHRAEQATETAAAAAAQDTPQGKQLGDQRLDDPSPRGSATLRRAMSCNTPMAKRQRVEADAVLRERERAQWTRPGPTPTKAGHTDNHPDEKMTRKPVEQKTEPVTPAIDAPEPARDTDMLSDYGDDDFDDDMLAELDASLVPASCDHEPRPASAAKPTARPLARPAVRPAGTTRSSQSLDEFGDMDDDVFAAAEDLMAEIDSLTVTPAPQQPSQPTQPTSHSTRQTPLAHHTKKTAADDMEDMYEDDFGADFDYDEAERAATQAVAQTNPAIPQSAGTSVPWANLDNSSGPKLRAIQRYLVTNVIEASFQDERLQRPCQEKILVVKADRSNEVRRVHLRGDWTETPASTKAFVHVIGTFDTAGVCVVDNEHNMIILHPDQLVSSTVVADSFQCIRRAVLQDRVKATGEPTPALVYGTLLHEIFQEALMANRWDRSFLAAAIDGTIQKYLEKLYTIRVEPATAREHLLTQTRELPSWAATFLAEKPNPQAVVQGRNGKNMLLSINKLLDVEEHVWSPMYGLKGNIDATVQVTTMPMGGRNNSQNGQNGQNSQNGQVTLTVPFELKTGRNASSSHQAQTVLYNLLLSDRYDIEIVSGVLYYMESAQMLQVPTIRHELRHMILQRNQLACHVRERSVQLPPMLRSSNTCGRCYAQSSCFVYHKLADGGDGETSGMGERFEAVVQHLTPRHRAFFVQWEDLLTKEERESQRLRRELWTMVSSEREKLGRCFGDLVLADRPSTTSEGATSVGTNNNKINRFHYSFFKKDAPAGFSFADSQLAVGEPIVVSDEEGHFALALGFVTTVRRTRLEVAVDRRLHNVRERQPGFDEHTNQVFTGIMEVGGGRTKRTGGTQGPEIRYRVDKDEFSNGMATVRNNLVQVMAGQQTGAHEIRQLVVDLVAPRFRRGLLTKHDGQDGDEASLNIDQQQAIDKVMRAQDYALVLGMPGTGKTTTIAHIIRALVRQGKSVLLTSYTHTAVDNILLKLGPMGSSGGSGSSQKTKSILRLGAPAKVHPDVRELAILAEDPEMQTSFEAIRQAWHGSPVVATTCLGISHPIFHERTFDYCIVDEASQITLPICLGPIRMARTFVLVGDHNQLPPLVQNEEARAGGLDVSLFKLLSDAHPAAVTSLAHQYRMCEDIMTLSNTLIYGGRLRCGYEGLRQHSLHVPDMAAMLARHHDGGSLCQASSLSDAPCWLRHLIEPQTRVAFINTDAFGAAGREQAKGNRIVNPSEARLTTQLVEALLTAGVAAADIGVMTPYRSQLALLRHSLRHCQRKASSAARGNDSDRNGGSIIEMHTADRFQGRDKEVVVLSLVRSNEACSIGELLKDWRRINVAFTRAKTKLLVLGSRSTLGGSIEEAAEARKQNLAMNQVAEDANGGQPSLHSDGNSNMLARFVALMEDRQWIYELPETALDSHVFDDEAGLATQASLEPKVEQGQQSGVGMNMRSPLAKRDGNAGAAAAAYLQSPTRSAKTLAAMQRSLPGKENKQPRKRARPGEGMLLKGKPVLKGILDEMMSGY